METYQWFLLGMMAGFIPCFIALAFIVMGACCRTIRVRHCDCAEDDHP
jgi:hypothetical protein